MLTLGHRPGRRLRRAGRALARTRSGVVDELGELTFGEIHRRSNALARALAERGVGEGDSVAVMCRNHRGFVDATVAVAKLGADILYLNTAFAGPQLVDVLEREDADAWSSTTRSSPSCWPAPTSSSRVLAWTDEPTPAAPTRSRR